MPATEQPREPVDAFYSYSPKDERLRNELENHLALLQRQGVIKGWYDRRIQAGDERQSEIDEHLNSARIILLLVSVDFIASDYCYGLEMERALERHERGEAIVIPIILRPVDWESSPFGKLQALPKDNRPVTKWSDRDEAFANIAQDIRKVIEKSFTQQAIKLPALDRNLSSPQHRLVKKPETFRINKAIWIASIATILVITTAYWQLVYKRAAISSNETIEYTGRVTDLHTHQAIHGAKVTIDGEQGLPQIYYTDAEGIFHLKFPKSAGSARIQIAAKGYMMADRNVRVSRIGVEDIRLTPVDSPEIVNPATMPSNTSTPPANSTGISASNVAGSRNGRQRTPGGKKNKADPYRDLNYNEP